MKTNLGKLFFPRLERDQRRRAMGELYAVAFTTATVSCTIAVIIVMFYYRR